MYDPCLNPRFICSFKSSKGSFENWESEHHHWNGLPFPPPGDLPDPGIEPISPALQVDSFTTEPPGKPFYPVRRTKLKKKKGTLNVGTNGNVKLYNHISVLSGIF